MPKPSAQHDLTHCDPANFKARVAELGGTSASHYALAVSGGVDSLALLRLAHQSFPDRITVLSVDHRLRPEAETECAFVASICQQLQIPHQTLTVSHPPANQAEARTARYALMAEWCEKNGADWLLTGHHLDDQAETLLLRLNRGSGISGLSGIRPVRKLADNVRLMRSLLPFTRAQLQEVVQTAGWQPVEDPSNSDPKYDRSHVRQLLAREPLLAPKRIAQTANHLLAAEEALQWATMQAFRGRATETEDGIILNDEALPSELRRRLIQQVFLNLGKQAPDGPALSGFIERITSTSSANLGGLLARRNSDGLLHFTPEPRRKPGR